MSDNNNDKIKKTANMKEYMKKYMKEYVKNNKNKWTARKTCELCGKTFSMCNRTNHEKGMVHKYALLEQENKKLQQKNI